MARQTYQVTFALIAELEGSTKCLAGTVRAVQLVSLVSSVRTVGKRVLIHPPMAGYAHNADLKI